MPSLRHTKSRQAVLRAIKLSPRAISAEQIKKLVARWQPEVSQATVYRNLNFLTRRGEIYRLEGQDGKKEYSGHAFHEVRFNCQRCGEVRELPKAKLEQYVNHKIWGSRTVFFSQLTAQGLCESCLRLLRRPGVRP